MPTPLLQWASRSTGHAPREIKKRFTATSEHLLLNALPGVFAGNYGGEHWLASFALMALE
ncbi:MAG: DUF2891 family protein [Proteiniphilum sp.]